ncbi:alpha/beta fold hydrolase [Actinophytocola oryzae]|nr:alpha/beta fold hydrolase [Actinophytocola oryzae]
MRRRAGTVAMLTVALVLGGTPSGAHAEDDPFDRYNQQQLTWGPCPFTPEEGALPSECALVTVPRDWAAPDSGVDLQVAISRVRAAGERLGVVLFNPGGPGGQGTSLPGAIGALQPALSERYDLIGMDPRGTGQEGGTAPFDCAVPTDRLSQRTDLDARDRSADSIAEHLKYPRAVAEACQSDALTPYITTWQTAYDMELIRQLLAEPALNYVGYSYGTWLGAKYASLFPASAGKIVLDSSVNWQGRLQADFEAWPPINQRMFDDSFLPWTSRQFPDLVGTIPADAGKMWERVRTFFAEQGILAPDTYDAVFVGMGSELRWVVGALILTLGAAELQGTEPTPPAGLRTLFDEQSTAAFGVPVAGLTTDIVAAALRADDYTHVSGTRYAVACGDQPTKSARWYQRLSDRQGPEYPLYGWAYGLSEPCGFWSDAPKQELPSLPAEVAGRVLVVQGELDPQTGYEEARAAVRAAPGVTMVAVDDSPFHGQYTISGNPCVDGMVNVFLLRNSRPGNSVCPGVPLLGETEVFPVAGPVTTRAGAQLLAAQALPELRESVADRIAAANGDLR